MIKKGSLIANHCTNKIIGYLLHSYELNVLPEKEQEEFDLHLLECDYCFEQLTQMQEYSDILRFDKAIPGLAKYQSVPVSKRLLSYLWPELPYLLRPSILIVALILMIYPAYLGINTSFQTNIREIQSIALTSTRSTSNVYEIIDGRDIVISFLYLSAVNNKRYNLTITSEDGNLIYNDHSFTGFDQYNTGRLIIPNEDLVPGTYTLQISDNNNQTETTHQSYIFKIVRTTDQSN